MLYVNRLLTELGIKDSVSSVLVQTAYCNSRCTDFLLKNNIHHELVKTGVKNAHPVVAKYDVGANDEPNGHGTVVTNFNKIEKLLEGNENKQACDRLLGMLRIFNQYVGDSIANMLAIETILYDLDMSV